MGIDPDLVIPNKGLSVYDDCIAPWRGQKLKKYKQLLFDSTWILITILFVGLHSIFNRFILEFRLKQQIRKQFETYLDPRQVAELQLSLIHI